MRCMFHIVALMGVAMIAGFLATSVALAYEEGAAGKAVVEGIITFKGTPPTPTLDPFDKHANAKYCSKFDNDGKGNRLGRNITVNNSHIQDVVVYIRNISKGKSFSFNGTDVKINGCRFLVQDGPSTFVGVVVEGAELRVLDEDPGESDPTGGAYHVVHLYRVDESSSGTILSDRTIYDRPIIRKEQILKYKVKKIKGSNVILMQGDNHNFMMAWFYLVENPYYAIVGRDGTYVIDQVPPGKYELVAWHPTLGTQEKEIVVGATGKVTTNFEFSK